MKKLFLTAVATIFSILMGYSVPMGTEYDNSFDTIDYEEIIRIDSGHYEINFDKPMTFDLKYTSLWGNSNFSCIITHLEYNDGNITIAS